MKVLKSLRASGDGLVNFQSFGLTGLADIYLQSNLNGVPFCHQAGKLSAASFGIFVAEQGTDVNVRK